MRLSFNILNPFYKDSDYAGRDFVYKHWTLSENKSAEIQISKFEVYHLIDINIDLHWWGSDHAGPQIDLNLWGFMFNIKIYDHRHWHMENHCWEK